MIGTEERVVTGYHPDHFEALANPSIESEVMMWPGCEMEERTSKKGASTMPGTALSNYQSSILCTP
jgi:hypothetical protein